MRTRGSSKHRARYSGLLFMVFISIPGIVAAQGTGPVTIIPLLEEVHPLGAGCVPQSPLCDSARNSALLLTDIVLPGIETKKEKALQIPRSFATKLSYEHMTFDNARGLLLDGEIYSLSARQRWRVDNWSFGVLVPYDFFDLQSFNAHRVGLIGFGQYRYPFQRAAVSLTANGHYTHSAVTEAALQDVNSFGGGISLATTLDVQALQFGGAVSYQFYADDTEGPNNQQHLLKIGANAGGQLGNAWTVNVFMIWTYDATSYRSSFDVDTDYVELGVEIAWSITDYIHLAGGYKKVLGLSDVDSDLVFVGFRLPL